MIKILKSVVNCNILGLSKSFYFGHAFFNVFQYATTNENVFKGLKYVPIKIAQYDLQKCITWTKKSNKGKYEWNKPCVYSNLPKRKLNIPIKKSNPLFQL